MTGLVINIAVAAALFVGAHFLLSSQPIRARLTQRLGQTLFLVLYSVVALTALVWMLWAYAHAPLVSLWPQTAWSRWVPFVTMPVAMILLVCGAPARNPSTVGQERYLGVADPVPGILKVTRHPVMWSIALWAISHIPANGDVASFILFSSFALLALAGAAHIDRRRARANPEEWGRFAALTSYLPFAAIIAGRTKVRPGDIGWKLPVVALLAYTALLYLHSWLIGVSAWPA
ncbi:MAG: NnrU family protein [Acidiferrobacterales bacterium]